MKPIVSLEALVKSHISSMDNELLKIVNKLPSVQGYTQQERYADFRKVFKSQHGQRVLAEILSWGRLFRTPLLGSPVDPNKAMMTIGEANIARRLLVTYTVEPNEQPQRQEKS